MNFPNNLDDLSSNIEKEQIKRARDMLRNEHMPPPHQHIHLHGEGNVLNFMIHIQICAEHLMPIPCPQCNIQGVQS